MSAACLEDDLGEFREIVDAHKAAIMALAVNILGNLQDAEDAVKQWVYEPKIIDGKMRGVIFTVTVRFPQK